MKDIKTINKSGTFGKSQKVSESIVAPSRFNRHTIFEAVNAENQNRRQGTHKTKNKSEVSGTGKKPYKQKHTGRARQGSKRNPQFKGGGIVFGPTPNKNYCIRVNKKVSKIAFISALWKVIESEEIAILGNEFESIQYKTKEFGEFLKSAKLTEKKILMITSMEEKGLSYSAKNISGLTLRSSKNCSVRDLLNQNYLLISEKAIFEIYSRLESWI